MPEKNFKTLLPHLEKILAGSEEYISHQTALFLLGFSTDPGATITIVSPRRRRNRQIENFEIVFVFHSSFDARYTQKINVSGFQLPISSLEKTMIDLCKDQNYAPNLEGLARLFCAVPYNLKELLNIARLTSDTVMKRVALLTAWSGRAAYYELPLKHFKRTPIKLDTREEDALIWNNLFFCKLPRRLLKTPVSRPPEDTEATVRLWMELKALPEFCEKQYAAEMIFIRETPEPRINGIIENYFREIYLSFSEEKLKTFLTGFNQQTGAFPPEIPELLRTFLHTHQEILLLRKKDLEHWFFENLKGTNPDLVEALIFYGIRLNFANEVFNKFESTCNELFYAGKFKIINIFADHFLKLGSKLTPQMLLNITKTYSMQEKYDQALSLIEQARDIADPDDLSLLGRLHYAAGLVYNRMERAEDAMSELFLARESFAVTKEQEQLSRCELSLGNLYFSRGHPDSARSYYISGLNRARELKSTSLQASFMANLGMVDYDFGNFPKAARYFTQAYAMNKMIANHWTNSVIGMALGKLYLKLGQFSKAMRIFREIYPIRQERGNSSGLYEISSILAWICEINGKTGTAKTYWNQADRYDCDRLEPRSRFVGQMLRALNHFFHFRFNEAEQLFTQMLETAKQKNASEVQRGDCLHGMAITRFFLGRKAEAAALLDQASKTVSRNSARFQLTQINFFAAILLNEEFPKINQAEAIKAMLQTSVFDPLWHVYAPAMFELQCPEARKYLCWHLEHTPGATIKMLRQNNQTFDRLMRRLEHKPGRASEFFTILSISESYTIHLDDYRKWQQNYPKDTLIFDAPAGLLLYNDCCEKIKPGSIPHSILLQLFIAIPHPVEIESLYKSAWGMNFDPEYDFGAFKSSLQRLKHCLKKVANTAFLQRRKSSKGLKAVRVSVSVPWIVAFR